MASPGRWRSLERSILQRPLASQNVKPGRAQMLFEYESFLCCSIVVPDFS